MFGFASLHPRSQGCFRRGMLLEKHAVVDDDGDGDHENDCNKIHDDDIGALVI